jgi:hypothetical protein
VIWLRIAELSALLFCVVSAALTLSARADGEGGSRSPGPTVDADFPGGNIVVERVEGDEVFVHQDLRDTEGDWFWWHFRVRGAAGRALTVHFTEDPAAGRTANVIGVRGPAVSTDGGRTWAWLEEEAVDGTSFRYSCPADVAEVRFCFAMPYFEADLREFLARHERDPHLAAATLCETPRGRDVERLHVGALDGAPDFRVLITCRHHACECMASYTLEGLLEAALAPRDDGAWLRQHVEMMFIPFVDKDGVEEGDQGKNRRPHDHNRDYEGQSIHPSVRALREFVPRWSQGRLRVALDLHCPHIRGPHNEVIYLVGSQSEAMWQEQTAFGEVLASVRTGPLPYRPADNLPFGTAWNTGSAYDPGKSFCRWAAELPGIRLASTIEIPYANVAGSPVTPETARAFGRDLAAAIRAYLDLPAGRHGQGADAG